MVQTATPSQYPDDELPDALRTDLQTLYGQQMHVPPEIDARIALLARQHGIQQRRKLWLVRVGSGAAAAIVLLAAWLALHPAGYQRTGDIRDAFYLARQIKAGAQIGKQWDLNGDGVIDKRDVDSLAAAAVDLKRGTL